jgi:peroxiredoxin
MVAVLAVVALWTSSQPRSGALPVGSATPSITLPATTGEFTLARLRGSKVVLYFYEGAG